MLQFTIAEMMVYFFQQNIIALLWINNCVVSVSTTAGHVVHYDWVWQDDDRATGNMCHSGLL